jgi:hypothetical protein
MYVEIGESCRSVTDMYNNVDTSRNIDRFGLKNNMIFT